jgi:hypothetical protein
MHCEKWNKQCRYGTYNGEFGEQKDVLGTDPICQDEIRIMNRNTGKLHFKLKDSKKILIHKKLFNWLIDK